MHASSGKIPILVIPSTASSAATLQPYPTTLANSTLFENVTYAINQVHFAGFPTSNTHAYEIAHPSVQKHVSLLYHIILLLVFKAKGDVVATELLRERANFTPVWAKNSSYFITSPEENYLASLLGAFVELRNPIPILKTCRWHVQNQNLHPGKEASQCYSAGWRPVQKLLQRS